LLNQTKIKNMQQETVCHTAQCSYLPVDTEPHFDRFYPVVGTDTNFYKTFLDRPDDDYLLVETCGLTYVF
jgi:hypothetical protein